MKIYDLPVPPAIDWTRALRESARWIDVIAEKAARR